MIRLGFGPPEDRVEQYFESALRGAFFLAIIR
jgi:hypothetical protein